MIHPLQMQRSSAVVKSSSSSPLPEPVQCMSSSSAPRCTVKRRVSRLSLTSDKRDHSRR
jgi:hypothetical protein